MPRMKRPLSRSGSSRSTDISRPLCAARRSKWRSAAPSAASAKRLKPAICRSSDQMPASSASAASSATRRLARRSRRISAAASSSGPSRFSTAARISAKSGSGPLSTREERKAHSLTAMPLRYGLLPKIAASRRRPSGLPLQARAPASPPTPQSRAPCGADRPVPESRSAPPPARRCEIIASFHRPTSAGGSKAGGFSRSGQGGRKPVPSGQRRQRKRGPRPRRLAPAARVGRALRRLLRLFGALAAVLLLLAGFVMGRLLEGPLALDRLPPSLATVLGRAIGGVAIAAAGIRLDIDRDRHALDLEISGVRLKRPDGELLAAFPEIRTSFALTSLLRGRPRATRLVLERPTVRLIRDPDGAVRLGFGGGAQPPALAPAVLAGLAASPSPQASFVMPTRISVRDAAVVLADRQSGRRWRADHVDIALVRKAGGFSGDLSLAAAIGGRTLELHLGYSYAAAARTLELVLDFGNIEPAALASLDPALAPLAAFHVPLSGTFAIRL